MGAACSHNSGECCMLRRTRGRARRLHCPRRIHAPRCLRRPRRRLPGRARDDAHGALREQIREPAPERRARDDPPAALVSTHIHNLAETATDWRPVSPVERSCGTIGTTAVVSMSSSCSAVLYCRDASSARARACAGVPTYLADLRGPHLCGRDGEVPVARECLLQTGVSRDAHRWAYAGQRRTGAGRDV
jgi:hypothetical protein